MATLKVTIPENSQNIEGVATIAAPLEKVFEAHTDPELFAQWWGRGNPMNVQHFVCQDGGAWHVMEHAPDGTEHEFAGSFYEVKACERIVQTFEYLGMPERGHVLLQRTAFLAVDANTTEIRTLSTAQSQADHDGMLASGMESGWRESVEALGTLLEKQG
jgi:uncharacterized protein YndB with AHSA1/START domain